MSAQTVAIGLLTCSVGICFLTIAQGADTAPQAEGNNDRIMKEAEDLAAARERIGQELIAIAANSHGNVKGREAVRLIRQRIEAARRLAALQYSPAIDVLIQMVDLADPGTPTIESRADLQFPIAVFLSEYRHAAIPQIIDAHLGERDAQRRLGLALAIRFGDGGRHGKMTATALRYLRGTEPPDEDDVDGWLMRRNTQELEEQLEWLTNIVVAPDHAKD